MATSQRTGGPRLVFFSLGGTISMTSSEHGGVSPRLGALEQLSLVPALAGVSIEARTLGDVASANLSFDDVRRTASEIRRAFDEGATGVVLSLGTDTLEEMAFALDLTHDSDVPLVISGAMRSPDTPGSDAPANLLGALRVALSPAARARGALVVMNDEIHAARFVRKSHTSNPGAFTSASMGPVGWLSEDSVRLSARLTRLPALNASLMAQEVAIVSASLGDDLRLVEVALDAGYHGVVIEALGGGHVPGAALDRFAGLARRVPIVLASRTGAGAVLRHTYHYPGSEIDALAAGLIPAGALDARKARVLLTLALGEGRSLQGCREVFRDVDAAMGAE